MPGGKPVAVFLGKRGPSAIGKATPEGMSREVTAIELSFL